MEKGFKIKFDKNTIEHLGVKLYSSLPPVISELISNSYDADAENVEIKIDYDKKIVTVWDDGVGMNHDELNDHFLKIGRNRRKEEGNGLSKNKKRKVTGKKGLGKLAVFGIAKTIEVHSVKDNFENSFVMNYDKLKSEEKDEYMPEILKENQEINTSSHTIIVIRDIIQKNIMNIDELAYSLSKRFSFYDSGFRVKLVNENTNEEIEITKSLYFEKLEKEFEWSFPEDFENEFKDYEWFVWLKSKNVTGKIYTKKTPLSKSEWYEPLKLDNKIQN
ncbi:ATP-binding protein [Mycoplasmopsis citelli]|uniref:ATP-binding protein n=1 Tax=Mycoplasmopsis citelli TaxID=171281 RepID=UPI0021141412|nr:ATP-binding protein [Mycoplasmopsis citelli]UUD36108.1 ATP-binding protein [Mycoplasmopsis citelli]